MSARTDTRPVILYVEDDADDVLLTQIAFRQAGVSHRILRLHDGEEAIKYLDGQPPFDDRKINPLPCLILLDLNMPKVNGLEVLHWMRGRSECASLPVIVLTGSGLPSDRTTAKQLGVVDYEVKAVDFTGLLKTVQRIKTGWLKPVFETPPTSVRASVHQGSR